MCHILNAGFTFQTETFVAGKELDWIQEETPGAQPQHSLGS